eukprot:366399-Chlamydomonas_euryale.AAC.1
MPPGPGPSANEPPHLWRRRTKCWHRARRLRPAPDATWVKHARWLEGSRWSIIHGSIIHGHVVRLHRDPETKPDPMAIAGTPAAAAAPAADTVKGSSSPAVAAAAIAPAHRGGRSTAASVSAAGDATRVAGATAGAAAAAAAAAAD